MHTDRRADPLGRPTYGDNMERIPMTPEGYEKLKVQLKQIKSVVRPQNIKDIEEALEHGDLSENAEYHAAKEKQSFIAAQMTALEHKISCAEVIDPKKESNTDKIVFGATVTVVEVEKDEELTYKIVGDDESDIAHKKIAVSSPIARGLIGKSTGDEVTIKTPKGVRELEIIKIEYVWMAVYRLSSNVYRQKIREKIK